MTFCCGVFYNTPVFFNTILEWWTVEKATDYCRGEKLETYRGAMRADVNRLRLSKGVGCWELLRLSLRRQPGRLGDTSGAPFLVVGGGGTYERRRYY